MTLPLPDHLDPKTHEWLKTLGLLRIQRAVAAAGGEARVVGGAVRDALLGREVGEIDLACTLPPEKAMEVLKGAGLKVVPTGIAHGTITAVADHVGYEITTLRRDIATDGRHATVEFTDDWQADAARRDFTFNAMYVDASGTVYDYFGGRNHLAVGLVHFIGDAAARIDEDVLRILRYFRFHAWFGQGLPDSLAVAACRAKADLIPTLSVERVWREVTKLLTAENPVPAWQMMQDGGVLDYVLPEATNILRLASLLVVEATHDMPPSALVRLAALLPNDEVLAARVTKNMKLSNREAEKLRPLTTLPARLRGKLDPVPFRRALYEFGADACRDAALLLAATDEGADITAVLDIALNWEAPTFPIQGGDLLALGLKPGPRVGDILRAVEEWWMADDFRPTRNECLVRAKDLAAA